MSDLFLVSETRDGKLVNIIYNDKGKVIAWQNEEEGMQLQVAKDIELNTELLKRQINAEELERRTTASTDTQKAGEGRDLASKEHEEKQETKKQEKDEKQNENIEDFVKNFKGEINLDGKPKILLNERINGYYLYEILQIEDRLKEKLPEGAEEKEFRTGYLTIVDSEELTRIDGKERNTEDSFVITSMDGDIIELDENVLQPKELGTIENRKSAEQSRLRYANGMETEKPDTYAELTRTSMYQIPNVNEKFNVSENWFLAVDKNREWLENGQTPVTGYRKEASFVQVSRNESYYNREEIIQNTLEYKLKPVGENLTPRHEREEKEHLNQLKTNDANEAENVRGSHTEELVNKCIDKFKNWNEYYNRSDIQEKVEEYHNSGLDDDEVIEQIGEDIYDAEKFEHDTPSLGDPYRKH